MDLMKKFFPKQKTIQTLKVDTQGFRITINENPPTSNFFLIHQRALSMVKNASNLNRTTPYTMKNLLLPQLSASEIFSVAFFGYTFLKLLQNCDGKKTDISDMVHPRKNWLIESVVLF